MNAHAKGEFIPSPQAKDDSHAEITRITPEEAAVLQGYPRGFKFAGGKGKVGLQIGNAVPPLVAKAVLEELWAQPVKRKDGK